MGFNKNGTKIIWREMLHKHKWENKHDTFFLIEHDNN